MYYELTDHFVVSADAQRTWGFFSSAGNLPRITPPWLAFTIQTPEPIVIENNSLLDYTIKWAGVPIRWRNLGSGLRASVAPTLARVDIRGQRDALDAANPDSIDAFVDLAGLGPGRYNLRVQVDPSEDFGIVMVTPTVVAVAIR